MRALYVSQTGMTEPLGRSQVMPYLRGLAQAGWRIDLVCFEPESAEEVAIANTRGELAAIGIGYHFARRSLSHTFAAKLGESARALASLVARAIALRPRIVHARSYLPGAVAATLAAAHRGLRFIFDCRGLLGDEYADQGYWARDSFRYRLLKRVERQLFGRADAVVTLTERLRGWLRDEMAWVPARTPVEVVPCCVDLERFRIDEAARAATRARLGAGDRFVLAYCGNLGAWYCDEQMAKLFAAIRRRRPALFAVYTRAPAEKLRAALAASGVSESDVAIAPVAPSDMPAALAGGDAAVSFAMPWFSKIASSPVKVAEYLAVGLPVVVNRGVGDQDELLSATDALIDAGNLEPGALERAADVLLRRPADPQGPRRVAADRFCLQTIGVARYRRLYERLAGPLRGAQGGLR